MAAEPSAGRIEKPKTKRKSRGSRRRARGIRGKLRDALEKLQRTKSLRRVMKSLRRLVYWRSRGDLHYYREVIRLARVHAPEGGAVIDVGAHETKVLADLPWFTRRVALDRGEISVKPGVEVVRANFLKYTPERPFDLVLCLQVLEHIKDPPPFAQRLFATGRTVILSVPYRWPKGKCKWHVQDPVDEAKLLAWTGREPDESTIVRDDAARLIAVYRGDSKHRAVVVPAAGAPVD
jgi:hypothetical protein